MQAFARTAREMRTMKLHYYPEGGWGWVILFCASLCQCVTYGLILAAGTLLANLNRRPGAGAGASPTGIRNPSGSNNFILARYRLTLSSIAASNPIPAYSPTPLAGLHLTLLSLIHYYFRNFFFFHSFSLIRWYYLVQGTVSTGWLISHFTVVF